MNVRLETKRISRGIESSCGIIRIIVIIFKITFFSLRVALSMFKVASPNMHA